MRLFEIFGNKSNELCKAARNGATLLVKKLLEEGVDVNKKGDDGRDGFKKQQTPLSYAIRNGNLETINLLLDYGADLEEGCPLYQAAKIGSLEITKLLIERGAFVNGLYDTKDGSGRNADKFLETPLSGACSWIGHGGIIKCHEGIVKLFLEHKADVSGLKSKTLDTPLATALLYSDTPESTSKLLRDSGAPVNLHLCSGLGDLSMMQDFIDKGISPNNIEYTSSGHGFTPLYFAVNCNKLDAVKLLLDCGVSPTENIEYNQNVKSYEDSGVLALLIFRHGNTEMLKLLIEKGADVHKKVDYKTLIEYSRMHKRNDVAEILENA